MDDTVYLDKDLLTLVYQRVRYPLKAIYRMDMFKDPDEMMTHSSAPYGLDIIFEGEAGDVTLRFNFEHEAHRLNFALTLRILRTRDPTLDPPTKVVVDMKNDGEEEERFTYNRIVNAQHYNIDAGIPVIFSVSDLKIYEKIQSSSRHSYLEFFVRYPRQDRFLYAKSPTTHIPPQAMQTDEALRRKNAKKTDEEEEQENKKLEAR